MQRWAQQRCIVSNCVVYAKNRDAHLGYPDFWYAGRTRTGGESPGSDPTAASGGVKGGERVAAIGR